MRLWKASTENTAIGEITMFLSNWYGENSPVRAGKAKDSGKTFVQVNGSFKLAKADVSNIKYFFGVDVKEGEYLQARVTIFDKKGDNFLKNTNLNEKERFAFYGSSWKMTSFDKKDGSKGVQLEGFADYWRHDPFTATAAASAPVSASTAAPAPEEDDDDGDLPF